MKSNSRSRKTSNEVLSPYVVAMTIVDEVAAEVTAREMGWEPMEDEDGTRIWVRSENIGVDGAPCCSTAIEVVRAYAH